MSHQVHELIGMISQLEDELDIEKKKLNTVLQSIVDGVYTTDEHKVITFWNKGAERITGFTAEHAVGKSCQELLSHVDMDGKSLCACSCPISFTFKSKESVTGKDVLTKTVDGSAPVSVSCSPIIDHNGKISGAIEVFRDISERIALDQRKAEFMSMITHDMKTPLQVIIGYSELLRDDFSDGMSGEFLDVIIDKAASLHFMINDFLNLAKFESGMGVDKKLSSLTLLIDHLRLNFTPDSVLKNITLTIPETDIPQFYFDHSMLDRALSNLLSNALKFTPPGGLVSLTVSSDYDRGLISITISDTGVGFGADEKDRLFDSYYRSRTASKTEGTGLGLSIAKAVAVAHGGGITAHPNPGKGSSFILTIPFTKDADGR